MAEIYARGPIACGVDATPLHTYDGGIFSDTTHKSINHIISVVGWGTDTSSDQKYWIVRNSWGKSMGVVTLIRRLPSCANNDSRIFCHLAGEYWGELGYFRLEKGKNELGIESECVFCI